MLRGARIAVVMSACLLSACASLLPQTDNVTATPWRSFEDAKAAYDKVVPYKTTKAELHDLGIDPYDDPNVSILSYADIIRRFSITSLDPNIVDPGLVSCIKWRDACFGYQIEAKKVNRDRTGSFLLDFLNFKRTTETTGWRFESLLILVQDRVVHKVWAGQPTINETEVVKNPLGPFQGSGPGLVTNR